MMPFDSELRRSRRLSDNAPVRPSVVVDRSHARSPSDPGTAGALGPSGILRASPADESAVAPLEESETWENIPLTPRGHVRTQSAESQGRGRAGSHLPARSSSGRLGNGVEDDRASTIYGSTRSFPWLQEQDDESDDELDGYTTANDEFDEEPDDSVRAHRGSRRGSTDLEVAPAQQSHVIQIEQGAPTTAAAAAAAPRGLWARRGEVYKTGALLMDSVAALVASVGWVLNRKVPLFRPVGQALADTLHFSLATADAVHSGNMIKAGGKLGSLVGRGLATASPPVAEHSASASRQMNPAVWAAHTVGRGLVAYDAHRAGNSAAAAGQFAASAMALIGIIGTTLERFHAATPAFLALETISNFYTTAPPIGGAIQDARNSKVRMPWLQDPKVVAKELIALGTGMGGIASTLNQVYSLKDKEQGTHDSAHFASLISGVGAAGWFMSTIGYSMVMMIELRPAPKPDIEANPGPTADAPPAPDPGAGPSGAAP